MLNVVSCKHLCCREGTDKPPRSSKKPLPTPESNTGSTSKIKSFMSNIKKGNGESSSLSQRKRGEQSRNVETLDLTGRSAKLGDGFLTDGNHNPGDTPSFFDEEFFNEDISEKDPSSDYGASWMDDIPSPSTLLSGIRKRDVVLPQQAGGPSKGDVFEDPLDLDDDDDDDDVLQGDLPPLCQDSKGVLSESPDKNSLPCLPKNPGKRVSSMSPPRREHSGPKPSPSSGLFVTSSSSPILLHHSVKENKENRIKRTSDHLDSQASTSQKRQKYNLLDADQPVLQPNLNFPDMGVDHEKEAPKGWEGIDPSLLEEFKDLVDFI